MADYYLLAARCLLATVFAVAAAAKLPSPSGFAEFAKTVRKLTTRTQRVVATPGYW